MSKQVIKILFINFQSGMKMSQGYMEYFTNGWKYIFPHNSDSLSTVVEFINKEKPDIVSFAEIDGQSWRSKKNNQVQFISDNTDLKYGQFYKTRGNGKWINQGNAIISKYELKNNIQIKLPGYGEKRYLCSSNIRIDNKIIKYYTTHLSTNKQVNVAQRYFIAKKMSEEGDLKILAGDFNIEKDKLNIIKNCTDMIDVGLQNTFPTWAPIKKLDHIFVSEKYNIEKVVTHKNAKFSDHLPVSVKINIGS